MLTEYGCGTTDNRACAWNNLYPKYYCDAAREQECYPPYVPDVRVYKALWNYNITDGPWNMTAMFTTLREQAQSKTKAELVNSVIAYAGGSVSQVEKMALFGALKTSGGALSDLGAIRLDIAWQAARCPKESYSDYNFFQTLTANLNPTLQPNPNWLSKGNLPRLHLHESGKICPL